MAARFRTPDEFVPGDNPAASWDDWLETFRLYASATESSQRPVASQIDAFLYHVGPDARKIYKTMTIQPSTTPTTAVPNPPILLDDILAAFTAYYQPYKNLTGARHVFLSTRQLPHQSFDDFVTDLKLKAIPCDFGNIHDSLICSLIVLGVRDDTLRREMLKVPVLVLNDVIALCRADESSRATASAMSATRLPSASAETFPNTTSVDTVHFSRQQPVASSRSRPFQRHRGSSLRGHHDTRSRGRTSGYTAASYSPVICGYCAGRHPDKPCPAWGAECNKCHRLNHWAKACRQTFALTEVHPPVPPTQGQCSHYGCCTTVAQSPPAPLQYMDYPATAPQASQLQHRPSASVGRHDQGHALYDDLTGLQIASLALDALHPSRNDWVATLHIDGLPVTFKLDTGSQVNVLNKQTYDRLQNRPMINPTPVLVMSYSGHCIPMLGVIKAVCSAPSTSQTLSFYVTRQETMPILGAQASESLGLIQRLHATLAPESHLPGLSTDPRAILEEFRDCFDSVGCLPGEHSITLKPNAQPIITSPRKVPLALEAPLQAELRRMVELGIIIPVTEPTDWVHPMVLVPKPDGSLRVCLDPRNLNTALKREHYKMPTTQEIFSHLQGCKVFTVLDATSAFWHIRLTEASSKLCTFATPYGRFRFLRLPYGIASAPEIFQRTMHEIFKDIPCNFSSMDDLLLATPGAPYHASILRQILLRAREVNLRFSTKKLQLAVPEITYLGHTITGDGIRVDNRKVKAITEMPPPTDKQALQRFLGLVNYVSKFISNHSVKTAPLRGLLNKDVGFVWDANAQRVFDELKTSIIQAPVLSYFDSNVSPVVSVDSSQKGIGAVLLQNDHPIEYASTTLTDAQQRYAQIEKELLAVVYGLEHFHFYIVGNSVAVQTDHKPLLSLIKKPLHLLSPRLQRMILRISRYDPTLVYVPGTQLYIADTLSRAPLPTCSIKTDLMEGPYAALHSLTTLSPQKQTVFEHATANDAILQTVHHYVVSGWPQHKAQAPLSVIPYWSIKEEIHIMDNLLYRGDRLIVPETQRLHVLNLLHSAHQGINACVRKAKISVYWPGMTSEIEHFIQQCGLCRSRDKANQAAPLQPHPIPHLPWEAVGVDLYHSPTSSVLLIVDYHSKFVEINDLRSSTARSVIQAMKPHFARYGIPQRIMTDNGPPFNSAEFADFFIQWGVEHATSSPYYPQSNGMAERHVQTIKTLMAKAALSGVDPQLVLLEYRATPLPGLPSPAEMLMGRRLRTPTTTNTAALQPKYSVTDTRRRLRENQAKMKSYYDRHALPQQYSQIPPGTDVRYFAGPRNWLPARIVGPATEPDSYDILTANGQRFRRTRKHLKVVESPSTVRVTASGPHLLRAPASLNYEPPISPPRCHGMPPSPPPSPPLVCIPPPSPRLARVRPPFVALPPQPPPAPLVRVRSPLICPPPPFPAVPATPPRAAEPLGRAVLSCPAVPKISVSSPVAVVPTQRPSIPSSPLPVRPPESPPSRSVSSRGRPTRPPTRYPL